MPIDTVLIEAPASPVIQVATAGPQGVPGIQGVKGDPDTSVPVWKGVPVPLNSPLEVMTRGGYVPFTYPGNGTTLTYAISTPVAVEKACSIDQLSMYVSIAKPSSTITCALYNWFNTDNYTLTKVADLGDIDTSSTGLKSFTFSPIALTRGRYIVLSQTNGPQVQVYGLTGTEVYHQTSGVGGGNNLAGVAIAYQYGPPFNLLTNQTITLFDFLANVDSSPNVNLRRSS